MTTVLMQRKRCDRCGNEVELPDDGMPRRWEGLHLSYGGYGVPTTSDLCPDCNESFIAWWQDQS